MVIIQYERKEICAGSIVVFIKGNPKLLGQEEYWPWKTVEEVYDYCLEPIGLTFKELAEQPGVFGKREYRRYEQHGFGTISGKVELRSSIFEIWAERLFQILNGC